MIFSRTVAQSSALWGPCSPRGPHIALPLEPEEKLATQPQPPGSIPPRSPLPRVIIPSLIFFFHMEWPSFPSHRCLLKCHMKTWLKWKFNAFPTYCSFALHARMALCNPCSQHGMQLLGKAWPTLVSLQALSLVMVLFPPWWEFCSYCRVCTVFSYTQET